MRLLIAGGGSGVGDALIERGLEAGHSIELWSRRPSARLPPAAQFQIDLADAQAVHDRSAAMARPDWVFHTAHKFHRGPFLETSPARFEEVWRDTTLSAFHVARFVRARRAMIFLGATASRRGGPAFAAFASAKFALRGLVQSLSRALPDVHVAHVLVDGLIDCDRTQARFSEHEGAQIDPLALADVLFDLAGQRSSTWTSELDIRPAPLRTTLGLSG